jgi:hypothetical protein
MRDETLERAERIDAAKAAAPYVHPCMAPADQRPSEVRPLAERIAELDRAEAIEASEGKVVERKH